MIVQKRSIFLIGNFNGIDRIFQINQSSSQNGSGLKVGFIKIHHFFDSLLILKKFLRILNKKLKNLGNPINFLMLQKQVIQEAKQL